MKITPQPLANLPIQTPALTAESASASADASSDAATSKTGYAPSPELQRLLDLARAEPDVRSDRVQEVMQRLERGAYLSAATDQEVAQRWRDYV